MLIDSVKYPLNENPVSSLLKALQEEYDPLFPLGKWWKAAKKYKIKVVHPFLEDQTNTVEFPVYYRDNDMSSWSLFHKELDDLITQLQFDQENGDLLYYTFGQCLRDQALSDWTSVVQERDNDEEGNVDLPNSLSGTLLYPLSKLKMKFCGFLLY